MNDNEALFKRIIELEAQYEKKTNTTHNSNPCWLYCFSGYSFLFKWYYQ